MKQKLLNYLRRIWYFINPKFLNIEAEDGTLLQFEDFDCEEECFRFSDGERYRPIMEPTKWDADGKPVEWTAVAFIREA